MFSGSRNYKYPNDGCFSECFPCIQCWGYPQKGGATGIDKVVRGNEFAS